MPCLLLAQEGDGEVLFEALPAGTLPEEVLQQGQLFHSDTTHGGGRLYWQHSALAGQQNELASSLVRSHVCGDAVLVLPELGSESQLRQQVAELASRHLASKAAWRLDGVSSASPDCSARARQHAGLSPPRKRGAQHMQQQQAMLQQLLRRSGAAQLADQPESRPAEQLAGGAQHAPGTPVRHPAPLVGNPAACSGSSAPLEPQRVHKHSQAAQQSAAGQPAPAAGRRLAGRASEHGQQHPVARAFECEPRQQLLWSIAGRATSLSWGNPGSPAAPAVATAHGAEDGGPGSTPCSPPAAGSTCPAAAPAPAAIAMAADGAAEPAVQPSAACPPAKHRSSLEGSRWAELQPEMLALVVAAAGHSPRVARTLSQVCACWRRSVAEERSALRMLRFGRLEHAAQDEHGELPADADAEQLPWLVRRAASAGNVSAMVAAARLLERRAHSQARLSGADADDAHAAATWYPFDRDLAPEAGQAARRGRRPAGGGSAREASRFWALAAKAGHPEAQWKLGLGYYKGLMGLPHDCEEALMWLSRCARQLEGVVAASTADGPAAGRPVDGGRPRVATSAQAPARPRLPVLLDGHGCRALLAQAAHILGYLHLDGEGTRADTAAAIRWFRLAERCGCRDAGRVMGSLFNTGQYG